MPGPVHVASVRLPEETYAATSRIARRRRVSFNALVQEALSRVIAEELDREMYDAATLLGADGEQCDVEYAVAAQAEVALRDEA